jgi:hypothetical protein
MGPNPARARPGELIGVFTAVLAAAFIVSRVRAAVPGAALDSAGSYLVVAAIATLVFRAFRAGGRRAWAWSLTSLLLVMLAGSAIAAIASRRLAPDNVVPRIPAELRQLPQGLVRIGDWFHERPLTWDFREPEIRIEASGAMVVDGTPLVGYEYLAMSKPQRIEGGTHVVIEGVMSAGGISVGLQKANHWVVESTVVESGPFRLWFVVPNDDDFQLVVAYGVAGGTRTHVEMSPLTLWR